MLREEFLRPSIVPQCFRRQKPTPFGPLCLCGGDGQLKGVHSIMTGDACVAVFRVEFLATKAVLI